MTIAGGIMGALFHRAQTGEATTVDVSLLGTGIWSMGAAYGLSLLHDVPWTPPPKEERANPLYANYRTKDGRWLAFGCLQAGRYWAPMCDVIGRPELATDPRYADHVSLLARTSEVMELLREAFAERTLAQWRERLVGFVGQWTVVQDTLETAVDPQTLANGYIQDCQTAAGAPFRLVAAPVQYDGVPAVPRRAPGFNEHGDEILADLGLGEDAVIDLKIRGVVA
ncbi:hypothetical protein FAGKG844_280052 [Frankia sp. AgKG'84/4]